jgi:hypothetical protein
MRRFRITYDYYSLARDEMQHRIIEGCQFSDGVVGYVHLHRNSGKAFTRAEPGDEEAIVLHLLPYDQDNWTFAWIDQEDR